MVNPNISEDFIGRFGISYRDGRIIYVYDEITHGLYRFVLGFKEVLLVLSPTHVHQDTIEKIRGISKRGNEIILIPLYLNSKWIFYDIKKKEVRYCSPIKDNIRLANAITTNTNLFLVPAYINNPIIVFSLDGMNIVGNYDNWYIPNINETNNNASIWGASLYGSIVLFPIVNTNKVCYLDAKQINVITLDIICSVLSVSMSKDGIWILPMSGKYIYLANLKGEIIEKIDLPIIEIGFPITKFNRIVAVEEMVFLLPSYGSSIYSYQSTKREFVKIEIKEKPLWGKILTQNTVPYWDYIIEDRKLHLLPLEYCYKYIDIDTLQSVNYTLYYGDNIRNGEYWKLIKVIKGKYVFREQKDYLEDYIQVILCLHDKSNKKDRENICTDKGFELWNEIKVS